MISYLGVTIDELVQTFENSFAFTDDRAGRTLEEPIEVSDLIEDDEDELATDSEDADLDSEDYDDDDESEDVYVDDDGQLHALGETVPFAAEAAVGFLTDYVVADDIDEEWLSLDQARGALLALRVILPSLEEIPEIESAYSFTISRDSKTGLPTLISMKALDPESSAKESLTFNANAYEGVIRDDSSLVEMIEDSQIPEDDQELLGEILSEAVFTLADEQCGIIFDVKAFCIKITELAAANKVSSATQTASPEFTH